jgi:hypothetical protein
VCGARRRRKRRGRTGERVGGGAKPRVEVELVAELVRGLRGVAVRVGDEEGGVRWPLVGV